MDIKELTSSDFEYLEQKYKVEQLSENDLSNFKVIELDDHWDACIEILLDTNTNRYYRIIEYSGTFEEVFPTEITKIVYLPKELI